MIDDFVQSKSMLTPGMAGGTTMMITGTLVSQFGFSGAMTALVVSFLFGLIVWADNKVPVWHRLVLYVVNSFTIFSVAVGMNEAGMAMSRHPGPAAVIERQVEPLDEEEGATKNSDSSTRSFFQEWW